MAYLPINWPSGKPISAARRNGLERREDPAELRALKAENQRLERELRRKEKALAEAAALWVLQKKYRALLGEEVE